MSGFRHEDKDELTQFSCLIQVAHPPYKLH